MSCQLELIGELTHSPPPVVVILGSHWPAAARTCWSWFNTFARACFRNARRCFAHLDRVDEFDTARDVRHVTNYFQRRSVTKSSLEVETERLGQLQLRYAQVVLGSNQLRNLIVQLHVRLQHVEPWNCSRFKPVLLILQLSFQKVDVFLVHADEVTVDDDLVKLGFYRRR